MGLTDRGRSPDRRRYRPRLEGMESRSLLSNVPALGPLAAVPHHRQFPPPQLPSPFDAAAMVGMDNEPPLQAEGQIIPWVAGFPSFYRSLPPGRFGNARQILLEGRRDAPWVAHHGASTNIEFTIPNDPSKPIKFKNVIVTPSGKLVLNLDNPDPSTDRALPTRLTWKVDGMSSTGYFTGAKGQGIAEIVYSPLTGHGGSMGLRGARGRAAVYYSGLISPNRFALLGAQDRIID